MAESIARQSNPEDPESVLTEMAKAIPMRRLADPLEVGELAAFLASDESSYLTGTQNVIDGGAHCRRRLASASDSPLFPPCICGRISSYSLFNFQITKRYIKPLLLSRPL